MKLYTSTFLRYGDHHDSVSIALRSPMWYDGPYYKPLMPPTDLLRAFKNGEIDLELFTRWYEIEVLSILTPKRIEKDLRDGSILLCWCNMGFCHRRLVRDWLNKNGIETEELSGGHYTKLSPAH